MLFFLICETIFMRIPNKMQTVSSYGAEASICRILTDIKRFEEFVSAFWIKVSESQCLTLDQFCDTLYIRASMKIKSRKINY